VIVPSTLWRTVSSPWDARFTIGPSPKDHIPTTATCRRGAILDLDDTLYPRELFVQSGLMAVARHLEEQRGITAMDAFDTMSAARRDGAHGLELQAMCSQYGLPADLVAELLHVYRTHRPLLTLSRETVSVLARLRADGWRLVILTNGPPAVQRAKVQALGLSRLVDHVVYAEEHDPGGKPAAAVFREALRCLDVPASASICVGDDLVRDIAGARAAGIRTVRLATPGAPGASAADADVTIESLSALPDVAARLLKGARADAS